MSKLACPLHMVSWLFTCALVHSLAVSHTHLYLCNVHVFVHWMLLLVCVNIVYIIFCCLISRDEEEGARWCWQESDIHMKKWQLAPQCSVANVHAHSSAVYWNKKKVAWTFPIIIISFKCIVSLSILFKNPVIANLWITSLKSTHVSFLSFM